MATKIATCIRRGLGSNEAYRRLGELTSFQSGGCWIGARAIQLAIGGRLATVASTRSSSEHIVVEKDGVYYDSDGAHTPATLLRKMAVREGVPGPYLRPYRRAELSPGLCVDEARARAISTLLQRCRQGSSKASSSTQKSAPR